MEDYTGEDMGVVIAPKLLEGEKRVVLITHDESTFYCCEGKPMLWMENGKSKLLPKSKGTSIMVSGFVCPCHGMFSDNTHQSFQLFEAGKNREGWFTNKDIVAQFDTGQSRLIRKAYFEHPDYVPLLERAYQNWADLENLTGQQVYYQTGLLYFAKPENELIVGVHESANRYNLALETLDTEGVLAKYPQIGRAHV